MPPKTRSKERAKKTKHDREGSSSGARQGVSDLVAPGGRGLPHLNAKQRGRVEELQEKGVSGGFYFDYALLDAYGCREEVERMMSRQYWERLFSWRDDTYKPVVHEFIANFEPLPSNHYCTPSMKFNLFGRGYQLSIIQLGERLGLYTHEETMSKEWSNLPTDFDSDAAAEAYWDRITNGQGGRFTGVKQNTSKIVCPVLKMMKLLLNLTFGGRNKNLHKGGHKEHTNRQRIGKKHTKQGEIALEIAQHRAGRAADACVHPASSSTPKQNWAEPESFLLDAPLDARPAWRPVGGFKYTKGFFSSISLLPLQVFFPSSPNSQNMMNVGNISTSPLSSVFGSPPPSPKGIPRTEMMVPRHTLERGETSRGNHDDSSSEEGEGYNMEYANRGLMLQVEDLFRFRHFRAKEIIEWCYVDTPTLEALGIRREYERIATQPFWRAICSWRDATYTPIVREFVATLEVNEETRDRRFPSIKFKLFNKEYDISSDALGNLLGFYTLADQGQAWYANLVEDFESELQEDLFWWSIARSGVTWRASYTSARYIKVPELLILWHIVARSWLGRRTRNDNITKSELFILWSMYTETPVQMGELCKRILKRQSYEDSENIFIGPFVSRVAEALGFGETLSQEVVTTTMRPIDMEECVHLGLRFNDTMEGETRERERELWDTIRQLENRVDVLELEVRRLILDSHGEEPFELREWSSAPR
nr:putative retrotransposon Orf1 [Ipomoea batatas]